MSPFFLKLGAIFSKTLIKSWLNLDDTTASLGENLIDLFQDKGIDCLDQRELSRRFEQIGDNLAKVFSDILEKNSVDSTAQELIINQIIETLNKVTLTHKMLIAYSYNAKKLYQFFLTKSNHSQLHFSESEEQLYLQLLNYSAQYIVEIAPTLPNFTNDNIQEIVIRFDDIAEKINDIIERLQNINFMVQHKDNDIKNFERDYRNSVSRKYSYINLFGANSIDRTMRKYKLSIAYVELEAVKNPDIDDDYLNKIKISNVFNDESILWVAGEAGSGKTTFLQWLAISIVQESEDTTSLNKTIPIVIELRKAIKWPISLTDFITMTISDTTSSIPDNWLSSLLIEGKVLLLVDGLDEITEEQRQSIFDWLEELYNAYPMIKMVITARPTVKERPNFPLAEIEILPMNMQNIEKFITYWHEAVLVDQIHESPENSNTISQALIDKLQFNDPIAKLSTNPLLCAMICALNYKNNSVLPTNRNELYEECCKMLIDSRDTAKQVINKIELSYTCKMAILNDLAYWMLRNNKTLVSKTSAIEHLSQKLVNMGIAKTDNDVYETLQFLIERSGVLREPEIGSIDFIHKTFQEFMAANEISKQGDWGVLPQYALVPSWYETIILSISFANKTHADEVIRELILLGKEDAVHSKNYYLLAMLCSSSAIELSIDLRNDILQIMDTLIPPTLSNCKYLASVGELAIPFLNNNDTYTSSEKVACIRTLRLCDSPRAFPIITTYIEPDIDKSVLNEIEKFLSVNFPNEISTSCLADKIIEFIISQINDDELEISEVLLLSICQVSNIKQKLKPLEMVKKLKLTKYTGSKCDIYDLFSNISELRLYGNFEYTPILSKINKLTLLGINSENKYFDLYSLNKYKDSLSLRGFIATVNNRAFINGSDLSILKNAQYMQWRLINEDIEFSFDHFNSFKHLKTLLISTDYALDIDYSPLLEVKTLELLKIQVLCQHDVHMLNEELSYITEFKIQVTARE